MVEDKLLVWRLRKGDEDALRRIYARYKDDLLTIAVCLLCKIDDAAEVLHDVFVSFAGSAREFHLYGGLRSYLTTCVVSSVHKRLNSQMYEVIETRDRAQAGSDLQEARETVFDDEQTERLTKALSELPIRQREVIVMHLQGQMQFREIAKLQNISTNTARNRYCYGLEELLSNLSGEAAE
ncbi:MAG: RNA polymerase sigma factor [Planctomycetota bacterium]|jgi:RNA polymerase sigma-70 factor (ECF subfamily)